MRAFIRFITAAGRIGGGSVVLSIVLFGFSVYEHFVARNIHAYWLVLAAGASFVGGAYYAWLNADKALAQQICKSALPQLRIELVRAFFDVSPLPGFKLQVHIYAYLKVTNQNPPETLIKAGALAITVAGKQYVGNGDDVSKSGNALEHVTDFRLGGEAATEVFGDTLSRFPRLLSSVTPETPLRRGITQEGFFVFAFPGLHDWNCDERHLLRVTDAELSITDSFDAKHPVHFKSLNIANGVLIDSGRFRH